MLNRISNIIFTLDCFLFSIATLGKSYPFESFSSAAYRAEINGRFYGKIRPIIDSGFKLLGQMEHCKDAYMKAKFNLPEDQR